MKQTTLSIIAMLILAVGYSQPLPDSVKKNYYHSGYRMADFTGQATELSLHFNHEKVAYRKKDSGWVLLNPKGTRLVLDSLAKDKMGWMPVKAIADTIPVQKSIYPTNFLRSYETFYNRDSLPESDTLGVIALVSKPSYYNDSTVVTFLKDPQNIYLKSIRKRQGTCDRREFRDCGMIFGHRCGYYMQPTGQYLIITNEPFDPNAIIWMTREYGPYPTVKIKL